MESSYPESKSNKAGHLFRSLFWEFFGSAAVVYSFNFSVNNYFVRAITYFAFWMLAVYISGAHFNPAVTLAVYIAEGKWGSQLIRLIFYWLFQLMGAFAGVLMTYLIFNEPIEGFLLFPNENIPYGVGSSRFFSE